MTRKHGRILSLALIVLTLAAAIVFPITSAENTENIDVSGILNNETDASLTVTPFTGVVGSVKDSVVGINNYQNFGYSGNRPFSSRNETTERLASTGSGVVFYEGYVLTNYHVVEDAARVTVSTGKDDAEIEGEVLAYDENIDIAIVYAEELKAPAVPLGDSDQLQASEWAICIGNPLSEELRGTVTVGIVSAIDRAIESTSTTDRYGLKTTNTNKMIQTDAAINSGNSGGGLFNTLGQLMGIPTLKYSGNSSGSATIEGIGMAIPINSAKPLIEETLVKHLSGEKETAQKQEENAGAVSGDKPRLGITFTAITKTNTYEVYAGALPTGAMITEVTAGSPAEKAGLIADDIIVEADGIIVTGSTELLEAMNGKTIGDKLELKIYRSENLREAESLSDIKGEYIDITVTLTAFE